MLAICLGVTALLAICSGQPPTPTAVVNCTSSSINNIVEVGCWGYTECKNGILVTHLCPAGEVFEDSIKQCVFPAVSISACPAAFTCTGKPDAMYADPYDNCHSYYRCYGAVNIGSFFCPSFLIFNEVIQSCDFSYNVLAPCGTKPAVPPT
jgi:hypothetical protein